MTTTYTLLPACAGMILIAFGHMPWRPAAPRMRGDDPTKYGICQIDNGCSPHARG